MGDHENFLPSSSYNLSHHDVVNYYYYWFAFYTAIFRRYTLVARANDTFFVLKTLSLYGLGCQSPFRLYVYIGKSHALTELSTKTDDLYEKNEGMVRRKVMNYCIDRIIIAFKLLVSLYLFNVSMFLVNPLYQFIFNSKMALMFPFEIPFVDIESSWGFGATFVLQIIIDFYMVVGFSSIDGTLIFYGMQVCGMVDLMKVEFGELAAHLENGEYKDVPEKLRKIIESHQKFNAYITNVSDFFTIASWSVIGTFSSIFNFHS